jgi:putative transposase
MSERMTAALVCDALQMALWRRKRPQGVIIHSDRGSQYCSHDYQALVVKNKLIFSMSKRGDCFDNAAKVLKFMALNLVRSKLAIRFTMNT